MILFFFLKMQSRKFTKISSNISKRIVLISRDHFIVLIYKHTLGHNSSRKQRTPDRHLACTPTYTVRLLRASIFSQITLLSHSPTTAAYFSRKPTYIDGQPDLSLNIAIHALQDRRTPVAVVVVSLRGEEREPQSRCAAGCRDVCSYC